MADLPKERLRSGKPPFSYIGVDYFGPFLVRQGRSNVKRCGCLSFVWSLELWTLKLCTPLTLKALKMRCGDLSAREGVLRPSTVITERTSTQAKGAS